MNTGRNLNGWLKALAVWAALTLVTAFYLIFFYLVTGLTLVGNQTALGGQRLLFLVAFNAVWLLVSLFCLFRRNPQRLLVLKAMLAAICLGNLLWYLIFDFSLPGAWTSVAIVELLLGWLLVLAGGAGAAYLHVSKRARSIFGVLGGNVRETMRKAFMTGGFALVVTLSPMAVWDETGFSGEKAEAETVASLTKTIYKKQMVINEKGVLQKKLDRLESDLKNGAAYLYSGDPEAIAAELNRFVTEKSTANAIGLNRVDQAVKPERLPKNVVDKDPFLANFLRVKVVAYLKCTPDQLAKLLIGLEENPKFAYVERLEVKSFSMPTDKSVNCVLLYSTYINKPEVVEKKKAART